MKFLCGICGILLALNEGLRQSQVQTILQDSRGYVWLVTQDRLNRYDGYQIRQFHKDPFEKKTLPGYNITSLCQDSHQQLWVGIGQGICIYDRLQQQFARYTNLFGKNQLAQAQIITNIVEDNFTNRYCLFTKRKKAISSRKYSLKTRTLIQRRYINNCNYPFSD